MEYQEKHFTISDVLFWLIAMILTFEQFIPVIKQYANDPKRDINKLFNYAQHFGLEIELQKYKENRYRC